MLGQGSPIEPDGCGLLDQGSGGVTNRVGHERLVSLSHTTSLELHVDCTDLGMDFGALCVYKTVLACSAPARQF